MGSSKLQCAKELNQAMVYPHGSAITPTGHGPIKPEATNIIFLSNFGKTGSVSAF